MKKISPAFYYLYIILFRQKKETSSTDRKMNVMT